MLAHMQQHLDDAHADLQPARAMWSEQERLADGAQERSGRVPRARRGKKQRLQPLPC